jgi:predicted ATPase/tRNA A-37 threonylcarbamoyl transferase component Bud32
LTERPDGDLAEEIPCLICGRTFRLEQEETEPVPTGAGTRHESPVAVGQTISHYLILERLGGGGMGVVYKARDVRLGRSVALKFLPQELARDPQRLDRFRREARTASALNHPHICTIYDIDEHEGQPFIVMELIEGQTLRRFAARRPSLAALVELVGQVAKALAAAHGAGIVHRDIKPENIMVRDDGYAKLVDFGLARRTPAHGPLFQAAAADATTRGTVLGTVRYMSPEQARAETVSNATDLFSMGIVLYELATGEHPFPAESQIEVVHAIISEAPLRPSLLNPEIPAALEALIVQMLEKEPLLRPTAVEVETALSELIGKGASPVLSPASGFALRHTVGRQNELAELRAALDSVVAGRGLFVCVTGEPGIGKTTLVEDFLAELSASGRICTVGRGRCSERVAGAEAYLPLLEALESLVRGEGGEAVARVMKVVAPTWYAQVAPYAAEDSSFARVLLEEKAASQERLKRELSTFLQEASRARPLVIFLDDLHWADVSTIDLLAYIGSKCAVLRLLLVLTYRPTDFLLSKHPFVRLKQEFQARGVCREIALELLVHHDIERYLALEFPQHRFPEELAALIHARTEGNPLFMVDLLRHLRDRRVLTQGEGHWVLAQSLPEVQRVLPESVRSMIERKIAQLGEEDQRLLVVASVQGFEFEAAVVARALGLDAAEAEEHLERLERVHAFVRLVGEHEYPDRSLTLRYRFVHVLYQNALYASLRPTRRASLSTAVAQALVSYHGEASAAHAVELALLWETAREFARAAGCYLQAAQNAARLFANQEAVVLARRGLRLLEALPDGPERARQELALQIALGPPLIATLGWAAPEVEHTYTRARVLCQQVGETPQLFPALWGLWFFYTTSSSELQTGREFGEQLLSLAQGAQDPALLLQAHHALGPTCALAGDCASAQTHLEQAIALYDPQQHRAHAFLYGGHDPGVCCLAHAAWSLWLLGYPEQALRRSQETLALARELSHPTTLAHAHQMIGVFHHFLRDGAATKELADALIGLSAGQGLPTYWAGGSILRGWALAEGGHTEEGIAHICQGLAAWATNPRFYWRISCLPLLAQAHGRGGKALEGLAVLAEALRAVDNTGFRLYEPEMHRLKGELLLAHAPEHPRDAEACFRQAIALARRQGAKSWELRAVLSLSRLCIQQGRWEDARPVLAEIYGWFTEGFGTLDLQEAKALLDVVS